MYSPPAYVEHDLPFLQQLMREWSFATMISQAATSGLMATHLPFMLAAGGAAGLGVLTSHIARNNPQWEGLEGTEVLVIFQGPHSLVAVDWYENRLSFPTWNYGAIHTRGRVLLERDPERLRALLMQTLASYDLEKGEWRFAGMPEEMIAPRLQAIIGLRIEIESLEAKLKYNQDKSCADREGVRQALAARPDGAETAAFMARLEARQLEAARGGAAGEAE
jgi:transcriptional regulator